MITIDNLCFVLETNRTAYAFDVSGGVLRHLYYGAKLRRLEDYTLAAPRPLFAPGNAAVLEGSVSLEDMAQEAAGVGWGNAGESLVDVVLPDGGRAAAFRFAYYERGVKEAPNGLPAALGCDETLKVVLKEQSCELYLELYYTVYERCDAIVRWSRLVNDTGEAVTVRRLLSGQLDLPAEGYNLTTFRGAWAREMERQEQELTGKLCGRARWASVPTAATPLPW
jgi:alpha-galactosidase